MEAKQLTSEIRIKNYYKENTGKMVPLTFRPIKDNIKNRNIHNLEHEGTRYTDTEEITNIMHDWYQKTANSVPDQTLTLSEFLNRNGVELPQLDVLQQNELFEEFTAEEITTALKVACETSASGPSGQSIAFCKLLFLLIPDIMVNCNQSTYFCSRPIRSPRTHMD